MVRFPPQGATACIVVLNVSTWHHIPWSLSKFNPPVSPLPSVHSEGLEIFIFAATFVAITTDRFGGMFSCLFASTSKVCFVILFVLNITVPCCKLWISSICLLYVSSFSNSYCITSYRHSIIFLIVSHLNYLYIIFVSFKLYPCNGIIASRFHC